MRIGAKFRGGGPKLRNGIRAMPDNGSPPPRMMIGSRQSSVAGFRNSLLPRVRAQVARIATPSGISPIVTIRHSAMRSFRANATIMVLRMAPRASFVATRYHCASALSFWNMRKRKRVESSRGEHERCRPWTIPSLCFSCRFRPGNL